MVSCFGIFKGDATNGCYSFLNCLIPASATGKKNAEAVCCIVYSLIVGDIDIIIRKQQAVAYQPLIRDRTTGAEIIIELMFIQTSNWNR